MATESASHSLSSSPASAEHRDRIVADPALHSRVPATDIDTLAALLAHLIDTGADHLPLPGQGGTLSRWQTLADVAGLDLSLVKLFEGHTDALAIIAEHEADALVPADGQWGMWAAEPPFARVAIEQTGDECDASGSDVTISGRKAWCSGAPILTHGLMTAWQNDAQRLVAVALDQPGVNVTDRGWEAVGMAATASVEVEFDHARALLIGPAGGYLERPGFWQGGAGIAACWFGGARALGETLRARAKGNDNPHLLAHLGAVDVALESARATLREAARWIDAHPRESAQLIAMRARAVIENAVNEVIHHTGRALGAGPYCRDPAFAQRMADLPVFLRQSHAERDLEALGRELAAAEASPWGLSP
ncbi:acyl-CoA dehydrogenase family protein [Halomonas sp. M20]|uniref:acyl-CoA dehydrogenase family protein n=1 Tax=Halomonas sp. M20 TaxID=2763264 RepID=UPI001D09D98D|nr:acyl-CoA dehydrogenase family protein [Halomonas sp. M20]